MVSNLHQFSSCTRRNQSGYQLLSLILQEIKANGEPSCIKPIYLDPPIRARYLEISPKEYYGAISLRVEVLGCRDNGKFSCNVFHTIGWGGSEKNRWFQLDVSIRCSDCLLQ